jgi:hypothetical protein
MASRSLGVAKRPCTRSAKVLRLGIVQVGHDHVRDVLFDERCEVDLGHRRAVLPAPCLPGIRERGGIDRTMPHEVGTRRVGAARVVVEHHRQLRRPPIGVREHGAVLAREPLEVGDERCGVRERGRAAPAVRLGEIAIEDGLQVLDPLALRQDGDGPALLREIFSLEELDPVECLHLARDGGGDVFDGD